MKYIDTPTPFEVTDFEMCICIGLWTYDKRNVLIDVGLIPLSPSFSLYPFLSLSLV